MKESEFQDIVVERAENWFGERNVHKEVYLEKYGRFCDIVIYTPFVKVMIEVENNAHEFVDGLGQAILYSRHDRMAVGMIVTPPTDNEGVLYEIDEVSDIVPIVFVNDKGTNVDRD